MVILHREFLICQQKGKDQNCYKLMADCHLIPQIVLTTEIHVDIKFYLHLFHQNLNNKTQLPSPKTYN